MTAAELKGIAKELLKSHDDAGAKALQDALVDSGYPHLAVRFPGNWYALARAVFESDDLSLTERCCTPKMEATR